MIPTYYSLSEWRITCACLLVTHIDYIVLKSLRHVYVAHAGPHAGPAQVELVFGFTFSGVWTLFQTMKWWNEWFSGGGWVTRVYNTLKMTRCQFKCALALSYGTMRWDNVCTGCTCSRKVFTILAEAILVTDKWRWWLDIRCNYVMISTYTKQATSVSLWFLSSRS